MEITWKRVLDPVMSTMGHRDVRTAVDYSPPNPEVDLPHTGFQVKKSPMLRTEILDKMRPEDVVRPIIRDLANRSGAYIIVSAESTSETTLRNRHDAMREAVGDLPNAKDLALDFYDRVRVVQKFIRQFSLLGWDLSRAAEVQATLQLLDDFADHLDPTLAEFAKSEKSRLSQAIAEARKVRPPI